MTTTAELLHIGGHPVLDLVNTVAPRVPGGEGHDHLGTPAELLVWAAAAELLTDPEAEEVAQVWAGRPATAREALRAVVEVREAAFALLAGAVHDAQLRPSEDETVHAASVLAARRATAAARSELVPASTSRAAPTTPPAAVPSHRAARLRVGTVAAWLLPDRLADAAVTFLTTADLAPLRACPLDEGGCGWLFLDLSRNHSRRWCSMAECGSQVKARRLTARRRATS